MADFGRCEQALADKGKISVGVLDAGQVGDQNAAADGASDFGWRNCCRRKRYHRSD
jgi:hypothetical protein